MQRGVTFSEAIYSSSAVMSPGRHHDLPFLFTYSLQSVAWARTLALLLCNACYFAVYADSSSVISLKAGIALILFYMLTTLVIQSNWSGVCLCPRFWHCGSSWHSLGKVGRRWRSFVKTEGHRKTNLAEVVGATSSEGFWRSVISDMRLHDWRWIGLWTEMKRKLSVIR